MDRDPIADDVIAFYAERCRVQQKLLLEVRDSLRVIQMDFRGVRPDIAEELVAVRRVAAEAERAISVMFDVTAAPCYPGQPPLSPPTDAKERPHE